MTEQELLSALEAIIYAADEPATLDQIVAAITGEKTRAREAAPAEAPAENSAELQSSLSADATRTLQSFDAPADTAPESSHSPDASRAQVRAEIRSALDKLVASYAADERGIEIRKVAGGWKMYTKAQHHELVRRFIKALRPPLRLTMPALETLSVIAYKQPATLPEINEIRGVNCGGVVKTLLERRLITTAGRKDAVGRPILYRTSKDFLMRFGLADLDELPSLKEFEQLAQPPSAPMTASRQPRRKNLRKNPRLLQQWQGNPRNRRHNRRPKHQPNLLRPIRSLPRPRKHLRPA